LIQTLTAGNESSGDRQLDPAGAACDSAQTPIFQSDRTTAEPVEPFRERLHELFRMRRDVRRFRTDALPAGAVRRWIEAAGLAPSVGLSQPWRFVSVASVERRSQIVHEFEQQNEVAAQHYDSGTSLEYRRLKLAGLREAPEQIAVFVDPEPTQGRGLGRMTMPESVAYSVVAAIQNFWLAARCEGIGVGWVSILRPDRIREILDVPGHWRLIAYLCVGYPLDNDVEIPELETCGWENRRRLEEHWYEK
jgi:5,6-dimethylbenzimidazole synthase